MSKSLVLREALAQLAGNREQDHAAHVRTHCVVLAGPGSGKTKTLTTAMALTLIEDVADPRGVACITYNNECAIELETRLAKFGIRTGERTFIGTVHSFALTQVIAPYARCIKGSFSGDFRVATAQQTRAAVEMAYNNVFGDGGNPEDRWRFAELKRRRDVNRTLPAWKENNPELADFIEAYEAELRRNSLIDFDDMPLMAYRMVSEHRWIGDALRARFPVLFVDEYQDLGHALHELVLLLCFAGGIRLFAVGDADQSIYGFTGANPELLQSLTKRADVETIQLKFNYRSGSKIIRASLGALGEERAYCGVDGASEGKLTYCPVVGGLAEQAKHIADVVVPNLLSSGFRFEQIAVLYRAAKLGDYVADALKATDVAFVRTDNNALVKRSSRLARFIESCAEWVTGGWRGADPPFNRLLRQAVGLVYDVRATENETQVVSHQLIQFLRHGIGANETTHTWLLRLHQQLIVPWQNITRNAHQEWNICTEILAKTDPALGRDIPLNVFAGSIEGTGRVTLSTLHSVKGREFDAVIMFGVNNGDFPNWHDNKNAVATREARRLFYVGVTRPRKELCLVYEEGNHSPWIAELHKRSIQN